MMRYLLPLLLVACESELTRSAIVDAGHPVPLTAPRCRDCHAPPDEAPGDAPPAPTWHVLDCCGPEWDDCDACHRTDAFRPPTFAHSEAPLDGAHRTAEGAPLRCDRCHTPRAPTECEGCHTRPPSHTFVDPACDHCHSSTTFRGVEFEHVPLERPHPDVRCGACHLAPEPIGTDCTCCHTRDAFGAPVQHAFPLRWRPFGPGESPEARTACFPDTALEQPDARDCDACHPGPGFGGGAYRHRALVLTGAHDARREIGGRTLAICDQCHEERDGSLGCGASGCHPGEHAGRPAGHPSDDLDCASAPGCHRPDDRAWSR